MKIINSNKRKRWNKIMTKQEKKEILNYAVAVSFLVDNVEDLLENYEIDEELTEKSISKTRKRIEVVKSMEIGFKNVLGIKE